MDQIEQSTRRLPLSTGEMVTGNYNPDDLFTIHEVAKFVGVDDTTARRWISYGSMKAVILPHRGKRKAYRIRREDVYKAMGYSEERKQDNVG